MGLDLKNSCKILEHVTLQNEYRQSERKGVYVEVTSTKLWTLEIISGQGQKKAAGQGRTAFSRNARQQGMVAAMP